MKITRLLLQKPPAAGHKSIHECLDDFKRLASEQSHCRPTFEGWPPPSRVLVGNGTFGPMGRGIFVMQRSLKDGLRTEPTLVLCCGTKPMLMLRRSDNVSRSRLALAEPAVEPAERSQQKHREVLLLLNLGAPVPSRSQPAVNAAAGVVEVVRAAAVEGMPEEVGENLHLEVLGASELRVNVRPHGRSRPVKLGDLLDARHDGRQYPRNLGVLVYEHERVGHVVVPEVNHVGADPRPDLLLHAVQDLAHPADHVEAVLDAVEPLPGVAQAVGVVGVEQVGLGVVPEREHVVGDLAPERQRLEHVRELARVPVTQPGALAPGGYGEVVLGVAVAGVEVLLQVCDHEVTGPTESAQVGVVVGKRVEAGLHLLRRHLVLVRCTVGAGKGARQERKLNAHDPAGLSARVLVDQVADRLLLGRDFPLHLAPRLPLRRDFHRRHTNLGVLQHVETPFLAGQQAEDGFDGGHTVEVQQLLDLRLARVHQKVHQLAVRVADLVRVEDLVAPADLEDVPEELGVLRVVPVAHQPLPVVVIVRHRQTAQDGAHLLDLPHDLARFVPLVDDVDLVRVLADVQRAVQQAHQFAFTEGEPQGRELRDMQKVLGTILRFAVDGRWILPSVSRLRELQEQTFNSALERVTGGTDADSAALPTLDDELWLVRFYAFQLSRFMAAHHLKDAVKVCLEDDCLHGAAGNFAHLLQPLLPEEVDARARPEADHVGRRLPALSARRFTCITLAIKLEDMWRNYYVDKLLGSIEGLNVSIPQGEPRHRRRHSGRAPQPSAIGVRRCRKRLGAHARGSRVHLPLHADAVGGGQLRPALQKAPRRAHVRGQVRFSLRATRRPRFLVKKLLHGDESQMPVLSGALQRIHVGHTHWPRDCAQNAYTKDVELRTSLDSQEQKAGECPAPAVCGCPSVPILPRRDSRQVPATIQRALICHKIRTPSYSATFCQPNLRYAVRRRPTWQKRQRRGGQLRAAAPAAAAHGAHRVGEAAALHHVVGSAAQRLIQCRLACPSSTGASPIPLRQGRQPAHNNVIIAVPYLDSDYLMNDLDALKEVVQPSGSGSLFRLKSPQGLFLNGTCRIMKSLLFMAVNTPKSRKKRDISQFVMTDEALVEYRQYNFPQTSKFRNLCETPSEVLNEIDPGISEDRLMSIIQANVSAPRQLCKTEQQLNDAFDQYRSTPFTGVPAAEDLGPDAGHASAYDGVGTRGFSFTEAHLRRYATIAHRLRADPLFPKAFAMDCEMVSTSGGTALARVTVVDSLLRVVFDAMVKPQANVTDYRTLYSGITAEGLSGVQLTLENIKACLNRLIDCDTVLVGHSLDHDLNACKISHVKILDTSMLYGSFNSKTKPGLKTLAKTQLDLPLMRQAGHDSYVDSATSMFLAMLGVVEASEAPPLHRIDLFGPEARIRYGQTRDLSEEPRVHIIDSMVDGYQDVSLFGGFRHLVQKLPDNMSVEPASDDSEAVQGLVKLVAANTAVDAPCVYVLVLRDFQRLCFRTLFDHQKNVTNLTLTKRVKPSLVTKYIAKLSDTVGRVASSLEHDDIMIMSNLTGDAAKVELLTLAVQQPRKYRDLMAELLREVHRSGFAHVAPGDATAQNPDRVAADIAMVISRAGQAQYVNLKRQQETATRDRNLNWMVVVSKQLSKKRCHVPSAAAST
ncbi:exoribonuclease, putative [Babesia caballi]|uniref:Exoribonuclease, putative n=1 Tax=Babesia caballi TaxID=5871 RepID=A0AAV4LPF3_BABCB|nr:exoribonuclease, putative [Babesia caballi]